MVELKANMFNIGVSNIPMEEYLIYVNMVWGSPGRGHRCSECRGQDHGQEGKAELKAWLLVLHVTSM